MRAAATAFVAIVATGAAQAAETPICTDRPAKANAVCTVPVGRLQLESTALGWSRLDAGGATIETLSAGTSVAKYGLTSRSDLQVAFSPYVRIKAKDGGGSNTLSGFGDVVVRYKHRLTANDAPLQVAVIPFAKVPTAKRGIGNRTLEGGLALPVSVPVGGVTVTLGPEGDILGDADGHGRHFALVNLVSLSGAVAPRLTLVGELWSNLNFDPNGIIRQISADAALAFATSNEFQLDAGVNAGLTRDTPDIEFYAGLSLRF